MGCCSVPLCSASSDYEVCVFSMPNNHELRIKWLDFLIESRDLAGIENPKFNQKKFYKICENHFLPEDVLRGAARKFLRKGAVPVRKVRKGNKIHLQYSENIFLGVQNDSNEIRQSSETKVLFH